MRRLTVLSTRSVMGEGTICATRCGASRDASSISRACAASIAMRASVCTCLLLSSAASTISRCIYGHVPMQMASVSSASMSSTQSSYTSDKPYLSAMRCPGRAAAIGDAHQLHTLNRLKAGYVPKFGVAARPHETYPDNIVCHLRTAPSLFSIQRTGQSPRFLRDADAFLPCAQFCAKRCRNRLMGL